jgi:putative transposase
MSWVSRKEYCEREGIKFRAFKYRKKSGLIQWRYGASGRGGEGGKHIEVWIDDESNAECGMRNAESKQKNRIRVNRGEPGCNVATELKDGMPIINIETPNPSNINDSPLSVPSCSSTQPCEATLHASQGAFLPQTLELPDYTKNSSDKCNRIANLRFALVQAFNNELKQNHQPKKEIIQSFISLYNTGVLLPDIHKELGEISRSTLYNWRSATTPQDLIPQHGGAGQSKITEHEKNLLLTLLLHQNRLKIGYAITLAKEYLTKKRIPSPSSSATLRRFVDQFKKEYYDLWVLRREGEKALNDKVLPYAERDWRLLEVGDGLVADGHRLNFQVIHPVTGKKSRAALVLFWDWRSSYPLGWEIMFEENTQCVASALRNAIIALGKIPKWVYLDNGKAFKAKIFTEDINFEDSELPGMFARLNINYHFAQPYNAQSKPIERIFGILNEQLERLIPSYTGASINDKPAWTKRNEKYARRLHNDYVPTILETNDLILAWRDRYAERPSRGRDGLKPIDIYNDGKGPGVDPAELIYLMMDREIKQIHRNGITWLGWHWFDEALYGLKDKVVIRYSLSDLSQIYVFHKNEFLCTAKPIEQVHPMASESENPKDMEAVKEVIRLKKKVKNTTRKLCDLLDTKAAAQIDWNKTRTPEISEAIQKIEDAKKPKVVNISPFVDGVKYSDQQAPAANPCKIDMAADHGSPLSCPWFADRWHEQYEWYVSNNPKNFNADDLDWIRWYEMTTQWESIYGNESGQRRLSHIKFKEVNNERSVCNNEKRQAVS